MRSLKEEEEDEDEEKEEKKKVVSIFISLFSFSSWTGARIN